MRRFSSEDWPGRRDYWRRELGRLRLGVEPLNEQLARLRRVAWSLTVVTGIMGSIFVALFTAFAAPRIGLCLGGLVFLPIVAVTWLDYASLKTRAARYERERREFEARCDG